MRVSLVGRGKGGVMGGGGWGVTGSEVVVGFHVVILRLWGVSV